MKRAIALFAGGALVLGTPLPAASPSSGATFKIDKRTIKGTPKAICVLEGKWADGELFRYEARDTCKRMKLRRVALREVLADGESVRGDLADIPTTAEILELSNSSSTVLIYRNREGEQHEVTTSD